MLQWVLNNNNQGPSTMLPDVAGREHVQAARLGTPQNTPNWRDGNRWRALMEFGLPVAPVPSDTSVTVERSTMPRGLEEELTSLLAKRNRKPCKGWRGAAGEVKTWKIGRARGNGSGWPCLFPCMQGKNAL